MTITAQVIESANAEGVYGQQSTHAIVETSDGTRYYIRQGYGGDDQLRGGATRWVHGDGFRALPGDTLDSIKAESTTHFASIHDAALNGVDKSRPCLHHLGISARSLADAAGL